MPKYIIKLDEYFLEWSTIVDAPVTYGMTRNEFEEYYQDEYGKSAMKDLAERMKRVLDKGTSAHNYGNVGELIAFNRAGDGETSLSRKQIIKKYCIDKN